MRSISLQLTKHCDVAKNGARLQICVYIFKYLDNYREELNNVSKIYDIFY